MALGQFNKIPQFLITQFLSVLCAIIFISVHYSQGYNVKHFLMCSPILFLLIIFYYFFFWRSQRQVYRCFCLVNLILLICSSVCFFAVYYGVFDKTLGYTLEKVSNCQIIGQMSIDLGNSEKYSILYVNYMKNGKNMLGYGCKSDLHESTLLSSINPSDFYYYNSKYPCDKSSSDPSFNSNNRVLNEEEQSRTMDLQYRSLNQRERLLDQSNQSCINYYYFSEVKLASWMCMPSSTSYEDMMKINTCYISNFQNNAYGQKDKSTQNAFERKALKKIRAFTIVEFDDMPVPMKYLIPLITFTFYPFIISTNVLTLCIAQLIMKFYAKSKEYKEQQFESEQILNRQESNKTDKQLSKQISIQSPTTVPSKYQPDEENLAQLKESQQIYSTYQMKCRLKPLSEEDIKQMKMRFQKQFMQPKQGEEEENNKEDHLNNQINHFHHISDQSQAKNKCNDTHFSQGDLQIQHLESSPQKNMDSSNADHSMKSKIEQSQFSIMNNQSKVQFKSIEKTPQRHQGKFSILSNLAEQHQFVDENQKTNVCVSENSPQQHSPISNEIHYQEDDVDDTDDAKLENDQDN